MGGIFISQSGYHPSAVAEYRTALAQRTVALVELQEIVQALNSHMSVRDLLTRKLQAAALTKDPLVYPLRDGARI